jgi:HK97 family phage major capsid protein
MTIQEVTNTVNELANAWGEFQSVNSRKKKDGHDYEQLGRIGNFMDEMKSRMGRFETALARPAYEGKSFATQDELEHKEAFCNYLRRGVEEGLPILEKKALSASSDADGGFLVTNAMGDSMVQKIFESSPLRQIAGSTTISSDTLDLIEDAGDIAAAWSASEAASVSESTTTTISKKSIALYELVAQPKATQRLIDDSSVDIEAWLVGKLVEKFSRLENTAFISGDGSGKPKGILAYSAGTDWGYIEQITSGSNANITTDGLIKTYYSLKEDFARNATFLMNRGSLQQVRLLRESTTGQYLWQPGLAAGAPDTLLGVPVKMAADMPAPATNSLSVAVGDFSRGYQIVDRAGVRVLRDPFTEKPFVKFYTTKRVGGDVVNFDAIKILKLAA